MSVTTIPIEPLSRVEGHLRIDVTVDDAGGRPQVVDARASGTLFRGFERVLLGRSPLDAPDLSERICGVCPVSHAIAAVRALERAANAAVPTNARVLRNIVLAADTLQNHVLHFYLMTLPDFVAGPDMAPWTPAWPADRRITGALATQFAAHVGRAMEVRRKCHEFGALFAGRLPHPPSFVPGGFTATPRQTRIDACRALVAEVRQFLEHEYQDDVEAVANVYADYYDVGAGPGDFLCYGGFDLDDAGQTCLHPAGTFLEGAPGGPIDLAVVEEDDTSAWYVNPLAPAVRVNAGGSAYTEGGGTEWAADYGFSGGSKASTSLAIAGTSTPKLYQSWRLGTTTGTVSYTFRNLVNGTYTVTLKFAETDWTAAGQRVFTVLANGQAVLPDFDIFASGGRATAVDRAFVVQVSSGQLVLQFVPVVDKPKICAIELRGDRVVALAAQAARVNAGGSLFKDAAGLTWSADTGFLGSSKASTSVTIAGTTSQTLYRTWRLGTATAPMVYTRAGLKDGPYAVTLHFDETYWTGPGLRLFDVTVNGQRVLASFDVYAAAGGMNRAVTRTVATTVAGGVLQIAFTPILDKPVVCAIEIAGTGAVTLSCAPACGTTSPAMPKAGAYSWVKAPRYAGRAVEVGPLARGWISGRYRRGVSVMDRHRARMFEAIELARRVEGWLDELAPAGPIYNQYTVPASGIGFGLAEAPRGSLGHWVTIANGTIAAYQVVTPTCWNASPVDAAGVRGPIEEALIGAFVDDVDEPIEVLRIVHSFDPCTACAVHVARPGSARLVRRHG